MADDKKTILEDTKTELPSNEELVESLVKGIEDTSVTNGGKEDECIFSQSDSLLNNDRNLNSDHIKSTQFETEKSKKVISDEGEEDTLKNGDNNEDEFIDEEHLKDLEFEYSEEDKLRLKGEAEELKIEGNNHFKSLEYKEAVISYTKALRICPIAFSKNRAILYANRGAAKVKLFRQESAIEDCTKAIDLDPLYLKALVRRAQLYEETDKLDEALADYTKILEIDPLHREALFASKRLPEQINERNEKLKTEMLGKLKDLGNMILKPFGLSTNNFQMVQDPNTGGYSVNFTQNTNHS